MLRDNQKTIGKQHDNKAGGSSNESMFGGKDRELRKHNMYVVPEYSGKGHLELEQGFNKNASVADMLRIRVLDKNRKLIKKMIFNRKDFEQALFLFAEGDESLKWVPGKVGKPN